DLLIKLEPLPIQIDEDVDLALDDGAVQGLVKEVNGTAVIALERVARLRTAGTDEYDGDMSGTLGGAHHFGEFEAADFWHLHVDDSQREFVLQQQFQCFVRRSRGM